MPEDAPSVGDREIVLAVVAPVGSPVDETVGALTEAFKKHGYTVDPIRISDLLESAVPTLDEEKSATRLRRLMNKGDRFRARLEDDAACGYLACQAILRKRRAATGANNKHRSKHVNLIRSLKTPDEVGVLRQIYGQRLIVVGVSASEDERRKALTKQLKPYVKSSALAGEVGYLTTRDEKDESADFGQKMRDAYRLADAFLAVKRKADSRIAARLVELILGEPWHTPTPEEQAMFHAWAMKFRSSAAGRQVGAAIVDKHGEVVALGSNDVPKPGGGQYWEGEPGDRRDFELGYDANARGKFNTVRELMRDLAESGWLSEEKSALSADQLAEEGLASSGPLGKGRLNDLVEFGRIVHAEMAALMTAAREGRPVAGCTLFTTTYPCHECARLIIGSGIERVIFIDPYQKSMAPDLYEDMFDDSQKPDTVAVVPFEGVSPHLFPRVFELSNRQKDVQGNYLEWDNKSLLMDDEEIADSIPLQEEAAGAYLAARMEETEPT
jgi:deoxycytidylate deaminase